MKKTILLLVLLVSLTNCKAQEEPKVFSEKALADTFIDINGDNIAFSEILKKYKGKQIFVDVWASWCKDCVVSMPKVNKLQKDYSNTVFLFLSLDKSEKAWKNGIEKYNVKGEHYYLKSGWKGDFATFIGLDWIPRYLIIDEDQNIELYRAVKAGDKNILAALKRSLI